MTPAAWVQRRLTQAPAVTALVPADRIRTPGPWHGMRLPAIIHRPVAQEPVRSMDAVHGVHSRFYQVQIYAWSYDMAERVADAVEHALEGGDDHGQALVLARRYSIDEETREGAHEAAHEVQVDLALIVGGS